MKKVIALAVIAAASMTGCASIKPAMVPMDYNVFAVHSVFGPKCVTAGLMDAGTYKQSIIDDNFIMSTVTVDQNVYQQRIATYKVDPTPITAQFCNSLTVGMAKTSVNAQIIKQKQESIKESNRNLMRGLNDMGNTMQKNNHTTYCNSNVIGNSIYSTCN